jgi:hypothetical protein
MGQFFGGLAVTFVISRLLLLALPKQTGREVAAAVISFALCFVLAAFGNADGGAPRWDAGWAYLAPQAVWLVIDLVLADIRASNSITGSDGLEAAQPHPQAKDATPRTETKREPSPGELAFWQSVVASTNASDFEAYLEQFPDGFFVSLARNRLKARQESDSPPQ